MAEATNPASEISLQPQIDQQPVNRLPAEVLSYIFAIAQHAAYEAGRMPRQTGISARVGIEYNELVTITQVCSRWRKLAIGNPMLWTSIHITRPPNEMTPIYISRTGVSTLLDIKIEMYLAYWETAGISIGDLYEELEHVSYVLDLLTTYGATVNRWKSLRVCTDDGEIFPAIIKFLEVKEAPALQSLSWEEGLGVQTAFEDMDVDEFSFSQELSLPNLSRLEFIKLPWFFLPRFPLAGTAHLTELALTAGGILHPPSKLHELLSAVPRLESLFLSTGTVAAKHVESTSKCPQLCLLSLHTLSLGAFSNESWVVCILQMIKAPLLRKLDLQNSAVFSPQPNNQLAQYIATGRVWDDNTSDYWGLPSNPTYPLLQGLDISQFYCDKRDLVGLLSSFPLITDLCVCGRQVECLGETPIMLPELVSLKFTRLVYPRLGEVLYGRAEAGFPVQTIKVHQLWRDHVADKLPDTIKIEEYVDPTFQSRCIEIDDDWELAEQEIMEYFDLDGSSASDESDDSYDSADWELEGSIYAR